MKTREQAKQLIEAALKTLAAKKSHPYKDGKEFLVSSNSHMIVTWAKKRMALGLQVFEITNGVDDHFVNLVSAKNEAAARAMIKEIQSSDDNELGSFVHHGAGARGEANLDRVTKQSLPEFYEMND